MKPIKHQCCTLCTFDSHHQLATIKTISHDILEIKKMSYIEYVQLSITFIINYLYVTFKSRYAFIEIDTLYNRGLRPLMFVFVYLSTKKIANVLHQSLFNVNQTIGKVLNTQRIMIRLPL